MSDEKIVCEYCKDSPFPGILFPFEFGDRPEPSDGRVWVARCDECARYKDDIEAANFLASATGYPVQLSLDRYDSTDEGEKQVAGETNALWSRPYIGMRLEKAIELMTPRKPTGKKLAGMGPVQPPASNTGVHEQVYERIGAVRCPRCRNDGSDRDYPIYVVERTFTYRRVHGVVDGKLYVNGELSELFSPRLLLAEEEKRPLMFWCFGKKEEDYCGHLWPIPEWVCRQIIRSTPQKKKA